MSQVGKAPVFIVACPRSGTSLLYHMLLSSGGFAQFRTEMNVFNVLVPIYGDPAVPKNRKRMVEAWLQSKAFSVSGLDMEAIRTKLLAECRSAGDFLRIVMGEVAREQRVDRWADSTPTNLLYIHEIKRALPEARVVHVIRDGRDVALSLDKLGWSRPFPWERSKGLIAAGLYWNWIVGKGRKLGETIKPDYMEVRYEDLVSRPRETLADLGRFISHDLDYERIQRVAIGSLRQPLSSFKKEIEAGEFNPVGRWKESFPREQLEIFESLASRLLWEFGYVLATSPNGSAHRFRARQMRLLYPMAFNFKQWVRSNTHLSKFFVKYSAVLIDK